MSHTPALSAGAALAFGTAAAFAGGGLVTQTVVVPQWRAMAPDAFLEQFGTYGPTLGATLFPISVVAVLASGATAYVAIRRKNVGRGWWVAATACMAGTVLLLPVYFAGANARMLAEGFPMGEVAGELASWYAWNWARTALAVAATVTGGVAIARRLSQARGGSAAPA